MSFNILRLGDQLRSRLISSFALKVRAGGALACLFLSPFKAPVNFTNPFRGRKWLSLLQPHDEFGITFKPNLALKSDHLGFTFETNELGFRWGANNTASGVILGSSFAMGLSVNQGENWYELCLDNRDWTNYAMPVSVNNQERLLAKLYEGAYTKLIYVYHPNIWILSKSYDDLYKSKYDAFEFFRWKTTMKSAMQLYPRWIVKECIKLLRGDSGFMTRNGKLYYLNKKYSVLTPEGMQYSLETCKSLHNLFSKFDEVYVVRAIIKEQFFANHEDAKLQQLNTQYNELWDQLQTSCGNVARFYDFADYSADYFHPFDTHWTGAGNEYFAANVVKILGGNLDAKRP